jgi:hypothetical protein
MQLKLFSTLTFLITTVFVNAQANGLRINPNINLPKDSVERKTLTSALNDFLASAQKPNEENINPKFLILITRRRAFRGQEELHIFTCLPSGKRDTNIN